MIKRMTALVLAGSLALSLAACGQKEPAAAANGQASTSAASGEGAGAAAAADKPKYAALFSQSVFLGDSITEGLSYHELLDEANVQAGAGKTAEFALASNDVEELAARKPQHVFIQLGSDDILWPTDDPKAYSLKFYGQLIDQIRSKLPDAQITILTVTPVTAEAEKEEPRYRNIADYNGGLKELAAKKQTAFTDLSPIFAGHPNLHDADGIHFNAEYYSLLLDFLKDQV
ncbi:GDSL-type esterase/lipase family protein [Paenibacillus doosanensis]|uniref:GDSL-type esterase/lipase family protein n=1 Tax=Paenibacillus doosanensis TaxID=1229154 RepID=UPI00218015D4|nr:GDSL-type esterase/lipase family protein [Paenibacillus doosanensis]MCS7459642.1 GDSL-type esterase/lipase family protein [Paenibacillus doosanensis]